MNMITGAGFISSVKSPLGSHGIILSRWWTYMTFAQFGCGQIDTIFRKTSSLAFQAVITINNVNP